MIVEFLAEDQLNALEDVIRKARTQRGIHRVPTSNGEAYAYQFNTEVYWHVQGPNDCNIAKGAVPLERPEAPRIVKLAGHAPLKLR